MYEAGGDANGLTVNEAAVGEVALTCLLPVCGLRGGGGAGACMLCRVLLDRDSDMDSSSASFETDEEVTELTVGTWLLLSARACPLLGGGAGTDFLLALLDADNGDRTGSQSGTLPAASRSNGESTSSLARLWAGGSGRALLISLGVFRKASDRDSRLSLLKSSVRDLPCRELGADSKNTSSTVVTNFTGLEPSVEP
jgi:hypothetical protein